MKKNIYVTLHTKEKGKLELTQEEWDLWERNPTMTLHRVDGPAIEWAYGGKAWLIDNNLHREDGPAVELSKDTSWWLNNQKLFSLTKEFLINYMKVNNLTVAHLFTDPDLLVREGATKFFR